MWLESKLVCFQPMWEITIYLEHKQALCVVYSDFENRNIEIKCRHDIRKFVVVRTTSKNSDDNSKILGCWRESTNLKYFRINIRKFYTSMNFSESWTDWFIKLEKFILIIKLICFGGWNLLILTISAEYFDQNQTYGRD